MAFNIIVCAKQVPDTNVIKINPKTGTLIRDGVPSILNNDDANALEQALQFVVADLETQIQAARLLVYRAADMKDKHLPYGPAAAMAKLFAAETAMHVTTKCVQLHGGYGYTKDYPVERMMRDAKITEIYEGTSEVQRMVIAASVLGK